MNTLCFVIWMIGWPFANGISLAYSAKCGIVFSEKVRGIAAIINFLIWIFIATLLWGKC